jgi:IS30 family transposase
MGRYSHPGIEEREDIMVRWRDHEGVSRIAREIGRDKSTVSREIARNGWAASASPGCVYRASTAQARADARRLACRRPRALDDPARRSLVASPIRDRQWSPEQVAGRMRAEAPAFSQVKVDSLLCRFPTLRSGHARTPSFRYQRA